MLMYILCEEVRPKEQAQTAFRCEQPQDPAENISTSQCVGPRSGKAFNKLAVPSWSHSTKGLLGIKNENQPHWAWSIWMRWLSYKMSEDVALNLGGCSTTVNARKMCSFQNLGGMGTWFEGCSSWSDQQMDPPWSASSWTAWWIDWCHDGQQRDTDQLALVMLLFNNGSSTICKIICQLVEIAATVCVLKAEAEHIDVLSILKLLLWAWTCLEGWLVEKIKLQALASTSWCVATRTLRTRRRNLCYNGQTKTKRKIILYQAWMTLFYPVILKINNQEMINNLNNVMTKVNNQWAQKLQMQMLSQQLLRKKSLIHFQKNRCLTSLKMPTWGQPIWYARHMDAPHQWVQGCHCPQPHFCGAHRKRDLCLFALFVLPSVSDAQWSCKWIPGSTCPSMVSWPWHRSNYDSGQCIQNKWQSWKWSWDDQKRCPHFDLCPCVPFG